MHVSAKGREENLSFLGIAHNISISGMLPETDQELKKGDRLTWTVSIGRREIVARGLVMRVSKPAAVKFRYGVKF